MTLPAPDSAIATDRVPLVERAVRVALVLTVFWYVLVLLRVVTGHGFRNPVADVLQFALAIAYVAVVPIACAIALWFGRGTPHSAKLPVGLLVIWLGGLLWLGTLTF